MREISLEMPFDVPRTKTAKANFHFWLVAMQKELGVWGRDGRSVGVGFVWNTKTGFDNRKLYLATRQMKRALKSADVVCTSCDPYNLEQKIVYIRDGEPNGLLTLKEGT
jgi:hypothetical protein